MKYCLKGKTKHVIYLITTRGEHPLLENREKKFTKHSHQRSTLSCTFHRDSLLPQDQEMTMSSHLCWRSWWFFIWSRSRYPYHISSTYVMLVSFSQGWLWMYVLLGAASSTVAVQANPWQAGPSTVVAGEDSCLWCVDDGFPLLSPFLPRLSQFLLCSL